VKESARNSKGEWYFSHTLAGMAFVTLAMILAIAIYLEIAARDSVELPGIFSWTLAVGVFGMLWFWIRMISDFLGERPARHPVLWGWVLLLGFAFGGLPYFWLVWRPRHRPSQGIQP
jgi:uncharacterized PurR-regulated membrane protein YhhQ (DUF165 family)